MATLFFMPWATVNAPLNIGHIRAVPYERGKSPGALGGLTQSAIDGVLGNYGDRAHHPNTDSTTPVSQAVILRWPDDDQDEASLSAEAIQDRMQQCQCVVFAALAHRRFGSHFDYCNSDGLTVIAQQFDQSDSSATAVTTRRRDGQSTAYVSGSRNKQLFFKPMHLQARCSLTVDTGLAEALLSMSNGEVRDRVQDAIALYNRANTDASEVPADVEIVMMRAALETLLGSGHKSKQLKDKLLALLSPYLGPAQWHKGNIDASVWQARWKGANRPIEAWVDDFSNARNESAHGRSAAGYAASIWSLQTHLLFASWFMPRVVKALMATQNMYSLTQDDRGELEGVEKLFAWDLIATDINGHIYWFEALAEVESSKIGRLLRVAMT